MEDPQTGEYYGAKFQEIVKYTQLSTSMDMGVLSRVLRVFQHIFERVSHFNRFRRDIIAHGIVGMSREVAITQTALRHVETDMRSTQAR